MYVTLSLATDKGTVVYTDIIHRFYAFCNHARNHWQFFHMYVLLTDDTLFRPLFRPRSKLNHWACVSLFQRPVTDLSSNVKVELFVVTVPSETSGDLNYPQTRCLEAISISCFH